VSKSVADQSLYDVDSVRILFDEMASTYGRVNLISSLGFAARWRHLSVAALPVASPRARMVDLMSGTGELWRSIALHESAVNEVVAIDISAQMMLRAPRRQPFVITVREEDVLQTQLPSGSFDAVVSSFGLKTFDTDQQQALSCVVARLLRPGGVFSFVEISVPSNTVLRALYMFYINRIIPLLGRVFLGNPANYRLLGAYTEAFHNCRHFAECLRAAGLQAEFTNYFFGCASGVTGRKPGA
jgi:ubiquinone/menaquinone biosynthesis methyltransferase